MYQWRNGTQGFIQNKTGSNALATHLDTKRNIPGGFLSPLPCRIVPIPLTNELNRADCEYPLHRTERKISHLLYMDGLKLIGRSEDDLENEIKIVKAISKDINMNFGLEKCARMCLKEVGSKAKYM
jgi:hypothetical protein